jgi:thiol-disulfide isomerase/thioredoxin
MMAGLALRVTLMALALTGTNTGGLATDLGGNAIAQLAPAGARAVVLFFAASDCPISNRYIPEIQRLEKEFGPRGVRVWFVYPNPGDSAKVVRAHDAEYSITGTNTALDTAQNLVQMAHVTITPEAAVFVPEGSGLREVYRGRIDDRYIAFGQERPRAQHHDLEDAIRAVLAKQPVPKPGGPPVGCSIVTLHP